MKVLIVSAADCGGGAFIAARRLHVALRKHGVDSTMLVAKKTIDDPSVIGPTSNVGHSIADLRHYLSLPFHLLHKTDNPNLHSFNVVPSSLHTVINAMDVDVVNLHWVNREMMSVADIGKITKPIVWTLHDMWPLLGSAHHETIDLNINLQVRSGILDLDEWMYRRKKKFWFNKNITFVGPSHWMVKKAKNSRVFSCSKAHAIVNPVDMHLYRPHSKKVVRDVMGLDNDKKYVLFGAISGASDPKKGFAYLKAALEFCLHTLGNDDIELLVFGGGQKTAENIGDVKYKVHNLGHFFDDVSLMMLYNVADIFVIPSLVENLPNTVEESLSCGTPVVAFAGVGGIDDMVNHMENGYLAELKNAKSLAEGIVWALERSGDDKFSDVIRRRAVSQFDEEVVVAKYLDVYRSVIG